MLDWLIMSYLTYFIYIYIFYMDSSLKIWRGLLLGIWCHIFFCSQPICLRQSILQLNLIGENPFNKCSLSVCLSHDKPLSVILLSLYTYYKLFYFSFLSLALVARQNNYVRPTLTEECLLDIQNGRFELSGFTVYAVIA
jgi:hypothetical protein